jgi:arginine repressor
MPVKEINKSEEIRKLHKNGVKSASEILAKLKARGIDVAPSQVYQVISSKKKRRKAKSTATNHSAEEETIVDHLVLFVKASGGLAKARDYLSRLALLHK